MKLVFLLACVVAASLAVPDKTFRSPVIVKVGANGRQVINGNRNGRNGQLIRRVTRKGRGRLAHSPSFAVPSPAVPLSAASFHPHTNPFSVPAFAQAPVQVFQPANAPFPLNSVQPLNLQNTSPIIAARSPFQFFNQAPTSLPLVFSRQEAPRALPVPAPFDAPEPKSPTLEYGPPATVAPEVRAPVEQYGSPSVVEVRDGYLAAQPEVREEEAPAVAPRNSYLAAEPEAVVAVRTGYLAAEPEEVVAVRTGYLAAEPAEVVSVRAEPVYSVPRTVANVKSNTVRAKPIAIVRSQYNPPAETSVFDYSFESANGIKQQATGTMRTVDDNEVSVMKGSYSYIGADGANYEVEWYADETGFHATAPHLPKSVEPNHPEVAAAVRAQIAFAAEEDAARAASSRTTTSYAAPEDNLGSYGGLASYN